MLKKLLSLLLIRNHALAFTRKPMSLTTKKRKLVTGFSITINDKAKISQKYLMTMIYECSSITHAVMTWQRRESLSAKPELYGYWFSACLCCLQSSSIHGAEQRKSKPYAEIYQKFIFTFCLTVTHSRTWMHGWKQ